MSVHEISKLVNDRNQETYEISDAQARERMDSVEDNMDSTMVQVGAAEQRMEQARQRLEGQVGTMASQIESLQSAVSGISESISNNVTTVNGLTGDVTLHPEDIGALPDYAFIPEYLSQLQSDGDHQTVTAAEKAEWYDKVSQNELAYVADRINRVINESGEPNVIDRIEQNGEEVEIDGRTAIITDTTYNVSVSGHTLTLTGSDGTTQQQALPNDSYDDAAVRGLISDNATAIGTLQNDLNNMGDFTADNVIAEDTGGIVGNVGEEVTAQDLFDGLAADNAVFEQQLAAAGTKLDKTLQNEAQEVLTSAVATKSYAAGDYIILNAELRKVTSSITIGDTIGLTNTERIYIADEISTIAGNIDQDLTDATAALQSSINGIEARLGAGLSFGVSGGKYGYFVGGAFSSFRAPTGDAAAGDVLSGKTFANASSDSLTGSMTNNGAVSASLDCGNSYTVPEGYHNGSGTVTANSLASQTGVDSGQTAATAAALRDGYQAWVNGSKVSGSMATLTSGNFSGTHSSTTAGAASNYVTKSTSAGYVANNTSVNSLAAATSPTIATTAATGTATINVKPGYYNKISVNQTSAYNAGRTSVNSAAKITTWVNNGSDFSYTTTQAEKLLVIVTHRPATGTTWALSNGGTGSGIYKAPVWGSGSSGIAMCIAWNLQSGATITATNDNGNFLIYRVT